MTTAGFKPSNPQSERPQTHALDRAATAIGLVILKLSNKCMCSGRFSPNETTLQCPLSKRQGKPQYQDLRTSNSLGSALNGTMILRLSIM